MKSEGIFGAGLLAAPTSRISVQALPYDGGAGGSSPTCTGAERGASPIETWFDSFLFVNRGTEHH